ncbi:hypothetical protein GCM10009091_34700 [Pseudomonas brenneri]|nr:hypothetical protein GCM10009091_34700 [Pseudomonas brenneri]
MHSGTSFLRFLIVLAVGSLRLLTMAYLFYSAGLQREPGLSVITALAVRSTSVSAQCIVRQ